LGWRNRPFRSAATQARPSALAGGSDHHPYGQGHVAWFGLFAVFALFVLYRISRWYANHLSLFKLKQGQAATHGLSRSRVISALVVLGLLVFSKYFYMASFTSYFTFYLIEKFDLSVASSQLHLFLFLGAVAAGTFFGGPIGDKIGRKAVIWFSILGVAPFTLVLPHVDLFWTSLQRGHRFHPGFGVLGHRGVRPGTGPG
jgi:FSR family fosmidomycin resistance protein-like MFS transporter